MGYDGDDAIVVLLLPPCVASYNYSSTLYYYALTYSGLDIFCDLEFQII
jgi:hypothetical protein